MLDVDMATLTTASMRCKNCELLLAKNLRFIFCVNYLYSNELELGQNFHQILVHQKGLKITPSVKTK